jgi:RNA-binding protein
MADLSGKLRSHLRSLAHHLKPMLHIGKEGVTEAAARSVEEALGGRELLKVKVLDTAPSDPQEAADELTSRIADAHVVQVIGRTIVIYRPDPEQSKIKLP